MELEGDLDVVKKDYIRDVKRFKSKLEETEKELEETRDNLIKLTVENPDKRLRVLDNNQTETIATKKLISKHQKEIEKLTREIEELKAIDKKQKARIRQLEVELESALKRATSSKGPNKGDQINSPYSRSRGNSPSACIKNYWIHKISLLY